MTSKACNVLFLCLRSRHYETHVAHGLLDRVDAQMPRPNLPGKRNRLALGGPRRSPSGNLASCFTLQPPSSSLSPGAQKVTGKQCREGRLAHAGETARGNQHHRIRSAVAYVSDAEPYNMGMRNAEQLFVQRRAISHDCLNMGRASYPSSTRHRLREMLPVQPVGHSLPPTEKRGVTVCWSGDDCAIRMVERRKILSRARNAPMYPLAAAVPFRHQR